MGTKVVNDKNGNGIAEANEELNYTIYYTNIGDTIARDVVVKDALDDTEFKDSTILETKINDKSSADNIKAGINVGNLAPNESVKITLKIKLAKTLTSDNKIVENQGTAKGSNTQVTKTTSRINPENPKLPVDPTEPPVITGIPITEFTKKPTNTVIHEGDIIEYIFSKFNNPSRKNVQNFQIVDIPPVGLEFVSGSLPAFNHGEGLTYSINYKTKDGANGVIATNIDASKPYNFQAPQVNSHISEISINFAEVPKDFGDNNSISLKFRVSKGHESKILVNKGYIKFTIDGRDIVIENQNDASVKVLVNTGDSADTTILFMGTFITLPVLIAYALNRKKHFKKTAC